MRHACGRACGRSWGAAHGGLKGGCTRQAMSDAVGAHQRSGVLPWVGSHNHPVFLSPSLLPALRYRPYPPPPNLPSPPRASCGCVCVPPCLFVGAALAAAGAGAWAGGAAHPAHVHGGGPRVQQPRLLPLPGGRLALVPRRHAAARLVRAGGWAGLGWLPPTRLRHAWPPDAKHRAFNPGSGAHPGAPTIAPTTCPIDQAKCQTSNAGCPAGCPPAVPPQVRERPGAGGALLLRAAGRLRPPAARLQPRGGARSAAAAHQLPLHAGHLPHSGLCPERQRGAAPFLPPAPLPHCSTPHLHTAHGRPSQHGCHPPPTSWCAPSVS